MTTAVPTFLHRHAPIARETAAELLQFFRQPRLLLPRTIDGGAFAIILATILAIDIGIDLLVNLLIWSGEVAGNDAPTAYPFAWSSSTEVFSLLLVAPVLEELQFRGWLNGRRRNLILAAVLVPPLLLLMDFTIFPKEWLMTGWIACYVLAAGMGFWWWRQGPVDQPVPEWFTQYFGVIVWGSTIAFGLIHAAGFSDFEWGPDLLYILPQTIGGMMLAFTRLKLGLGAAMLHHALFNAYTGLWDISW
jgi:hypothetical protein